MIQMKSRQNRRSLDRTYLIVVLSNVLLGDSMSAAAWRGMTRQSTLVSSTFSLWKAAHNGRIENIAPWYWAFIIRKIYWDGSRSLGIWVPTQSLKPQRVSPLRLWPEEVMIHYHPRRIILASTDALDTMRCEQMDWLRSPQDSRQALSMLA